MSSSARRNQTRVGFLGLGLMGSAMARRLLDQGFPIVVWDRSPAKVKALESAGAEPAANAGDVVREVDMVITMLPTADVVLEVVEPLFEDWPQRVIWLQMSSVGANEADQLTWTATSHGITLVDAPVSGSTRPAREGQLTVLASGPRIRAGCRPPGFRCAGVARALARRGWDGISPQTCGESLDDREGRRSGRVDAALRGYGTGSAPLHRVAGWWSAGLRIRVAEAG